MLVPSSARAQESPALTASQILDRAIAAQGLPKDVDPAAELPLALHALVNLQFTTDRGDLLSVDAERKFLAPKDGPALVWTRVVPTAKRDEETILAFNGQRPWLWSKAAAGLGHGVRWLDEPGGEQDRKQLEDDLDTTALLTRSFLLRNLPTQWKEPRRLSDVSGFGVTAWVIEGKAEIERDGAKKSVLLRLYVEQTKAWLMGARVLVEGEPAQQICFTRHETVDGVVVPGKIEIYVADEPKPRQTLYVRSLKLAPKLTPADFQPPR